LDLVKKRKLTPGSMLRGQIATHCQSHSGCQKNGSCNGCLLLRDYISRLGVCGGLLLSQPARLESHLASLPRPSVVTTRTTSRCGTTCGDVYVPGLCDTGPKNHTAFELQGTTIDAAADRRKAVPASLTSSRALQATTDRTAQQTRPVDRVTACRRGVR
jgi:hypothetical protein